MTELDDLVGKGGVASGGVESVTESIEAALDGALDKGFAVPEKPLRM